MAAGLRDEGHLVLLEGVDCHRDEGEGGSILPARVPSRVSQGCPRAIVVRTTRTAGGAGGPGGRCCFGVSCAEV